MRICIISNSDREALYSYTFPVLEEYAKLHNYDLRLEYHNVCKDRHISWAKIPLLLEEIEKGQYDYYVWMDDDIFITEIEIPLLRFITEAGFAEDTEKQIMISEDVVDCCPFNCGMMIVKAGAAPFLRRAFDCPEMMKKHNDPNWEQDAFIHLYNTDATVRELFLIVPHRQIQSFYRDYELPEEKKWRKGDFAAHITGMTLDRRLTFLHALRALLASSE